MPRNKQPSVRDATLEMQGDKLLDVLTTRLPAWAAGESKITEGDIRHFAVENKFAGQGMAGLYKEICGEHLPALGIIFYGMMRGDIPTAAIAVGMDKNPLHRWDAGPVIENLRKKYPRYDYTESVGDPFRPDASAAGFDDLDLG